MKKLILILVIAFPCVLFAQRSEAQLWENAQYQSHNGKEVYYTDVNVINSEYRELMLNQVKEEMLNKDGIVKVEFLHFNQTIRVYHFDFIEIETIKNFVLAHRRDIEVMNRLEYTFE